MSAFELGQAMALDLPTDHKMAVMMLAAAVDEYGFVKIDHHQLARRCGMPLGRLEATLAALSQAGVLEHAGSHVDGFIQDMFDSDEWYRLNLQAVDLLPRISAAQLAEAVDD